MPSWRLWKAEKKRAFFRFISCIRLQNCKKPCRHDELFSMQGCNHKFLSGIQKSRITLFQFKVLRWLTGNDIKPVVLRVPITELPTLVEWKSKQRALNDRPKPMPLPINDLSWSNSLDYRCKQKSLGRTNIFSQFTFKNLSLL